MRSRGPACAAFQRRPSDQRARKGRRLRCLRQQSVSDRRRRRRCCRSGRRRRRCRWARPCPPLQTERSEGWSDDRREPPSAANSAAARCSACLQTPHPQPTAVCCSGQRNLKDPFSAGGEGRGECCSQSCLLASTHLRFAIWHPTSTQPAPDIQHPPAASSSSTMGISTSSPLPPLSSEAAGLTRRGGATAKTASASAATASASAAPSAGRAAAAATWAAPGGAACFSAHSWRATMMAMRSCPEEQVVGRNTGCEGEGRVHTHCGRQAGRQAGWRVPRKERRCQSPASHADSAWQVAHTVPYVRQETMRRWSLAGCSHHAIRAPSDSALLQRPTCCPSLLTSTTSS